MVRSAFSTCREWSRVGCLIFEGLCSYWRLGGYSWLVDPQCYQLVFPIKGFKRRLDLWRVRPSIARRSKWVVGRFMSFIVIYSIQDELLKFSFISGPKVKVVGIG